MRDRHERVEPKAVWAGRLTSDADAARRGVRVGLEVLTERNVVGYDQPVQPGLDGGPGEVDQLLPATRILGGERLSVIEIWGCT